MSVTWLLSWVNLDAFSLLAALIIVFLAAIVRGYTGFGFSALVVASLTLFLPPAEVIPVVLLMEIVASIGMLPSVWKDVRWKAISILLIGIVIGAPLGVYLLGNVSEVLARIIISIIILVASAALLWGYSFKGSGNAPTTVGTGVLAGIVNGIGAAGGLPIVLFFLASGAAAAATRASLVALIFAIDAYTTVLTVSSGLVDSVTLKRLAIFLLPLLLGVLVGSRQFIRANPESFKRLTLALLIVLALVGLLKSVFSIGLLN